MIQRDIDRTACFFSDEDRQVYLDALGGLARSCGVAIHAYVLMTNHVHLLVTASAQPNLSALMKGLGQRYVQYVNRPIIVPARCGREDSWCWARRQRQGQPRIRRWLPRCSIRPGSILSGRAPTAASYSAATASRDRSPLGLDAAPGKVRRAGRKDRLPILHSKHCRFSSQFVGRAKA